MRDIRYRVLPDDETNRLYRRFPGLSQGYENWCPTCDRKGSYATAAGEVECDCETQVALFKWYASSGIGTTYMRLDWPDYHGPTNISEGALKYLDRLPEFHRRGLGLYFSGAFGTGKTFLANLVLKQVVLEGFTAFATTFAQTIEMYTAGWSDRDEKAYFQRKFINSEFLLLDDVGKELWNTKIALAETTFDAILRQRTTEGRPTIITTNLDVSDLRQGYGGAVLSLVREKSLEEVFTGDDFRPRANDRDVSESMKGFTRVIV